MAADTKTPAPSWFIWHFPRYAGAAVVLLGVIVIFGWHARWFLAIQVLSHLSPMQYNTAVCFILCGSGLVLLTTRRAGLASWLGGLAGIFAMFTLLQYVTGRDFGIDLLFFKPYVQTATMFPGRMSPLTASCFVLIGSGLALAASNQRWRGRLAGAGLLACMAGMVALVAFFGYIFGIETAYGWGAYSRIALHTAAAFLVLGGGLLMWSGQRARVEKFNFLRWVPMTGSVTLMAMIGIISLAGLAQLKNAVFWRGHTYQVLATADSFLGSLADMQRGMRGYVLTGNAGMLEPYRSGTNNAPRLLAQLAELTRDNPTEVLRLKVLTADLDAVITYARQLIGTHDGEGLTAAIELEKGGRGLAVMNQIRADLDVFSREEQGRLTQRDTDASANFNNTARLLVIGSVLAAGLLVLANFMASLEVKRRRQSEEVQRQLNRQLAETLTLKQAILASANYAIISTTADGVVRTFNATAEHWLGYTAAEVAGKLTPAIWHEAAEVAARAQVLSLELRRTIEPGFEAFTAKARLGQVDENEWTFIRKDGSRFPVSLSVTSLVDGTGAITGFLGVIADITERKQQEAEREKLIAELQQALVEVKTLSGMLPICASCKKIRDDKGYWNQVEVYVMRHSKASFSHGLCPACSIKFMEEGGLKISDRERAEALAQEEPKIPGATL